jgi:guanylate kinase/CYTH domain-containing protein
MKDRKIFILMGSSGSGKTTLGNYLKEIGIPEIVSHTTRKMRKGEIPGVTYYYITKEEFDKIEKIEWTEYPKGSGNFYCLSKQEVENKLSQYGRVFAITDVNGVMQLKTHYPNEVEVIYVYTSLEETERRMRARGDKEEKIQERLQHALQSGELLNYPYADYVIENNDLEESKKRLFQIVSLKEKKEIERKYLVKQLPDLSSLPKKEMLQGYISFEPEVRIRKENNEYYLIRKSDGDMVRDEIKEQITEEQFHYYSCFVLNHFIKKTRYFKLLGHHVAEIDVFHGELEGLVTVEVEFLSEEEANNFVVPDWFGGEVTFDKRYKNKNLVRYGRPS